MRYYGENGLIKKAEQAKEMQGNATVAEEAMDTLLAEYENAMAEIPIPELPDITPTTPAGTTVKKPNTWTSIQVTAISDGKGTAVPLPNGFYYVGGNREEGLVISDNSKDAKKGTGYDVASTLEGNQFVWIPISGEADLTRTNFDRTTGQPTTGLSTDFTEPYTSGGYSGEVSDYDTMKEQVLKYGGFYIGRYEAGDATAGSTLRTKATIDHTVVCKKGVAPYNCVPWGKSMSDVDTAFVPSDTKYNPDKVTTHGAVYLAKHMYDGKEQNQSVTSTLCYSSQWDAMCRYIGDNQRTTDAKRASELTGSVPGDVSKNIYDLAGNCYEWTMEAYNANTRAKRGGDYSDDNPVSTRRTYGPVDCDVYGSLRPTLYIK